MNFHKRNVKLFKFVVVSIVWIFSCVNCVLSNPSQHVHVITTNNSQINVNQAPKSLHAKEIDSISRVILQLIDKFYIQPSEKFEVRIYGAITSHLNDIISDIGRKINDNFLLTVKHFLNVNQFSGQFSFSALILTSDVQTLSNLNLFGGTLVNEWSVNFKFLVYCEHLTNLSHLSLPTIDHHREGHLSFYEYFIFNVGNLVSLVTSTYFGKSDCNKRQFLRLDRFNKTTQQWDNKLENLNNYKTFYGCELVFGVSTDFMFYFKDHIVNNIIFHDGNQPSLADFMKIEAAVNSDGEQYRGLFYEVFEALSKVGNFRTYYQFIFKNGELFDSNGRKEPIYFQFQTSTSHDKFSTVTLPFISHKVLIVLTPNAFYTNYEKILMPFDSVTWMLLGFTFFFVFGLILMINRLPREVRDRIYCSRNEMHIYNVLGEFYLKV